MHGATIKILVQECLRYKIIPKLGSLTSQQHRSILAKGLNENTLLKLARTNGPRLPF